MYEILLFVLLILFFVGLFGVMLMMSSVATWRRRAFAAERELSERNTSRSADYLRLVKAVAAFDGRRAIDTDVRELARKMLEEEMSQDRS